MKLKIALLLTFVAIGLHIYLAFHFYGLNYGIGSSESVCNISSQFNCDTVTASAYSAIGGVPIAMFGISANLVLAVLIGLSIIGWSENPPRLSQYTFLLAAIVGLTSVVMGSVSMFLIGAYCLFCMGAYLASFIVFALVMKSRDPSAKPIVDYLPDLFSSAKAYGALFAFVPLGGFFFHTAYLQSIGASQIGLAVRNSVADWQANPVMDFSSVAPSMAKGPADAKMILREFADFRCSHCRHAGPSLKAFYNSHSQVRVEFYSFPLDGTCNDAIPGGGDGISCLLARNVYCAEKLGQKGWQLHDHYFSNQDEVLTKNSREFVDKMTAEFLPTLSLTTEAVKACAEASDTDAAIRAQAKIGSASGVHATPTFYVNGRKLQRGNMITVLDAVHREATKK